MKRLTSLFLAVLMLLSVFAVTASALEPTAASTNLIVTKYQIKQINGETDRIGVSNLKGTEDEAPTGYDTLAGVEFTIYRLGDMNTYVPNAEVKTIDDSFKNGKITYKGTEISAFDTQTTKADGKAIFNVTKDNFGLFFVKETAAPANVTAKSQSFVVVLPRTNPDGNEYLAATYVYPKNYTTLGGGILQKIDSSKNNQGLEGAKFALYNKTTGEQVTADFFGNAIGDATNHYLTTDANGYIAVNNLLVGDYYFVETVAPEGYIIKSDKYDFSVVSGKSTEVIKNNDGTYTYTGIQLITADNSSKPQINKFVTSIGQKVDNVEFDKPFTWIIVTDVPSDMGTVYKKYTITDTMDPELDFVAGSISVSVSNDGTNYTPYTTGFNAPQTVTGTTFTVDFTDRAALAGVKKIKVEYQTTLNKEKTVMDDFIVNKVKLDYETDVTVDSDLEENPPKVYTGGFKFVKVSTDDSKLEGAKFDVYDANNKVVRTDVTSGKDGLFEVKGLKEGNYYLVETQAPAKHELLTTKFNFTVTNDSYTKTSAEPVKVTNVPTPDVPLTGGIGTTIFTLAGLSLIALAAVLFVLSRKTKKSN